MKLFRFILRSFNDGVSCRFHQPFSVRTLSTYVPRDNRVENKEYLDSFESADEARMFNNAPVGNSQTDDFGAKLDKLGKSRDSYSSNLPGGSGNGGDNKEGFNSFESADEARIFSKAPVGNPKIDAFYAKLDMLGKRRDGYASNQSGGSGSGSGIRLDGLDDSFSTLSDGMDQKLKKASMYFGVDHDEVDREDYCYRPDIKFQMGGTYTVKDLDLTKPGVQKPPKRLEFEVTTKEVLQKADFRNVRFLANFITEAGVIIKRSKTKISAKAQRRVAREIKTARAFGLMPFTTMGTKAFVFGQTMENLDQDFEYESFDNPTAEDDDLGV